MPQMAPTLWTVNFSLLMIILITIFLSNYFSHTSNPSSLMTNNHKVTKNWKW